MSSYKKTVISEIQYKPLTDKYGRDRSNQWEVMDRSKVSIQESVYITNIIRQYGQLRRMPTIKLKQIVKSHVMDERKETKTVKWATNVEIFEEEFEEEVIESINNEPKELVKELVSNYRCVSEQINLFKQMYNEKNGFETHKNEKYNRAKRNTFQKIETICEYESLDQIIPIPFC